MLCYAGIRSNKTINLHEYNNQGPVFDHDTQKQLTSCAPTFLRAYIEGTMFVRIWLVVEAFDQLIHLLHQP